MMASSSKHFQFALGNVFIIILFFLPDSLLAVDINKGTESSEDGNENVCLLYSAKNFSGSPILSVSPIIKVFETNLLFLDDDDDPKTPKNKSSSKTVRGIPIISVKLTKDNCSVILCNEKHLEGDCIQLTESKADISSEAASIFKSVLSVDCHCSFIDADSIVRLPTKSNLAGSSGKLQSMVETEGYPPLQKTLPEVPANINGCATLFREWHYKGQSFSLAFAGSTGRVELGVSSRVRSIQVKDGCNVHLWSDDKLDTFSTSSSISVFPTNQVQLPTGRSSSPNNGDSSSDNFEWACCSCDQCSESVCQNAQAESSSSTFNNTASENEDFSQFLKYGKKIIGIGRNYRWTTPELASLLSIPKKPIVFLKPTTSYIEEGELIKLPKSLGKIFYELELGVVIGKIGKDISEEQALDHVAGYFLALDMTAKEFIQQPNRNGSGISLPWEIGKGFDAACPVGRFIPKSMVPNPNNVLLECKVNGQVTQKDNTSNMIFNVQQLIAYVSKYMTLQPYDTILTGTPDGFGSLEHGDVVQGRMGNITSIKFTAVDDLK